MEPKLTDPAGLFTDTPRRRGFLLTAWLTLLSLGAITAAYFAVTETPKILEAYPEAPALVLWTKTALSVLNVLLIGGVWMWRRWALYALGGSTTAVYIINAMANQDWVSFLPGFAGYVALFLLIRFSSAWASFTPERDEDDPA